MKYISLFVCFFIGIQSTPYPGYEALISELENKVELVNEDKASFLSMKCRDVSLEIAEEVDVLNEKIQKSNRGVRILQKEQNHKKKLYELKKLEYSQKLVMIQQRNLILYPYRIEKELKTYCMDYEKIHSEYVKKKQRLSYLENKFSIYKGYMKRM